MSNKVDPKHFRQRFMGILDRLFDAEEARVKAEDALEQAASELEAIGGRSFAVALVEIATSPRRVCENGGDHDFIEAETGLNLCAKCASEARREVKQ